MSGGYVIHTAPLRIHGRGHRAVALTASAEIPHRPATAGEPVKPSRGRVKLRGKLR